MTDLITTPHLADPDGDGVANLLEYATAMSPTHHDLMPAVAAKSGATLEFVYTRNKTASDLSYIVEWSDDLTTWSTADVTSSIMTDGATTQEIKAVLPATVVRRFVRLNVAH